MNSKNAAALISGVWIFGGLMVGGLAAPHAHAMTDKYAVEVGDDNGDGYIDEDESGWDCATMGNWICGPVTVAHGVAAADGGAPGPWAWDMGGYVGGYN